MKIKLDKIPPPKINNFFSMLLVDSETFIKIPNPVNSTDLIFCLNSSIKNSCF